MEKYANSTASAATQGNGIVQLSHRLVDAVIRLNQMAEMIADVGTSVHGPRPEPVPPGGSVAQPRNDSLAARVEDVLEAVSRIERSVTGLTR